MAKFSNRNRIKFIQMSTASVEFRVKSTLSWTTNITDHRIRIKSWKRLSARKTPILKALLKGQDLKFIGNIGKYIRSKAFGVVKFVFKVILTVTCTSEGRQGTGMRKFQNYLTWLRIWSHWVRFWGYVNCNTYEQLSTGEREGKTSKLLTM